MCINNYPAGFGPTLHLLPCFVYGISEGAGETCCKPVFLVGWSVLHKDIQHDKGKVQL